MIASFRTVAAATLGLTLASPVSAATERGLPDWAAYAAELGKIEGEMLAAMPDAGDPRSRQEAWSLMFSQLVRGYLAIVYADPDYPEFVPLYNLALNIAAPNADYMYYGTPLDGRGTYRLRGVAGTNRFTFFQFVSREFDATGEGGGALGSFSLSDLKIAPDGNFELLLSADRPAGYTGNWMKLDPTTKRLTMRIASYDWLRERDPAVGIERLDRPLPRPRPSAEEISAKLARLPGLVKSDTMRWWRRVEDLRAKGLVNKVQIEAPGVFAGQTYVEGLFKLAPDEALIIETDIPRSCRYWSFLVGDLHYRTIDWANHQSSLNGFQARLDRDGKFRAVVALRDPGVPNWLDPGGFPEGLIQARWNNCDSQPVPTARLVKASDVRRFLPADTPMVSATTREQSLRERRLGAQLRRKW